MCGSKNSCDTVPQLLSKLSMTFLAVCLNYFTDKLQKYFHCRNASTYLPFGVRALVSRKLWQQHKISPIPLGKFYKNPAQSEPLLLKELPQALWANQVCWIWESCINYCWQHSSFKICVRAIIMSLGTHGHSWGFSISIPWRMHNIIHIQYFSVRDIGLFDINLSSNSNFIRLKVKRLQKYTM